MDAPEPLRSPTRPLRAWTLVTGLALSAWAALPASAPGQTTAAHGGEEGPWPPTGAEAVDWERTTTHDEVLDFLTEVDRLSDRVSVRDLGLSVEGRVLPAAFLGAPPPLDPASVTAEGRPTLLVLGSIHGNERSGKEGSLQFIRYLALGEGRTLLDALNVIVVPHMNPDGGESGRRENGRGYDLNRDWIVAESPEVSAVLEQLVTPFRPDVFVDAHNGGSLPYHLTYQTTLDPTADPDLVSFARGAMYEAIRSHLQGLDMQMYWYSGPEFDPATGRWYWRTTEPLPRKQHTYGGLQDMIALLFEVPSGHSLEVGAGAVREALIGLAAFLADEAVSVRGLVDEARRRTAQGELPAVHLELEPVARPGFEAFQVMRPSGDGRGEVPEFVLGEDRTLYLPSRSRPTPWGYALSPGLLPVVDLLGRHGIEVETLELPLNIVGGRYRVEWAHWSALTYQNHRMLDLGVELFPELLTLPAGTHLVRTAQPGGRLVPQLLEPDAMDSVVRWNFLDDLLRSEEGPVGALLPIVRLNSAPAD